MIATRVMISSNSMIALTTVAPAIMAARFDCVAIVAIGVSVDPVSIDIVISHLRPV